MKRMTLIALLALGIAACAGTETVSNEEGTEQAAVAEKEKPKMRCWREKETGTRLGGKRVCTPAGE